MLDQTPQWVAIFTSAHAEKSVTKQINEDLHIEAYLPIRHVLRKWSDRIKRVEVPLIPSYTFAKIRECDVWKVREVVGVAGFVRFKTSGIAVIPDREIDAMKKLVASEEEIHILNTNQLHNGAQVRVIAGDFEGMTGTIIRDCPDGNFSVQISNLNISLIINIEPTVLQSMVIE